MRTYFIDFVIRSRCRVTRPRRFNIAIFVVQGVGYVCAHCIGVSVALILFYVQDQVNELARSPCVSMHILLEKVRLVQLTELARKTLGVHVVQELSLFKELGEYLYMYV